MKGSSSSEDEENVNLNRMESKRSTGEDLEWDTNDIHLSKGEVGIESEYSYKKRMREEENNTEDDDGFTTVDRRGKKINRRRSPSNNSMILLYKEQVIEVIVTSKEILPKQIAFAKLLKSENIKDVMRVIYKSPFKILVRFKNDNSAENFMKSECLKAKGWTCRKAGEASYCYGLVKNIDLELNDEDVKEAIESDIEIIQVKRLHKKDKEGKWVKSETVRLCFKGSVLPPYVYTYGSRMKVEPFTFPVTQCSNCWKYGHVKNFCPSNKPICPKCGDGHVNCNTQTFKCVNCQGNHMSIVKSKCPAFKREKNVRDVMSTYNCTYKAALLIISAEKKRMKENTETPRSSHINIPEQKIKDSNTYAAKTAGQTLVNPGMNDEEDSSVSEASQVERYISAQGKKGSKKKKKANTDNGEHTDSLLSDNENVQKARVSQDSIKRPRKRKNFSFAKLFEEMKKILLSKTDLQTKVSMAIEYALEEVKYFLNSFINIELVLNLLGINNYG